MQGAIFGSAPFVFAIWEVKSASIDFPSPRRQGLQAPGIPMSSGTFDLGLNPQQNPLVNQEAQPLDRAVDELFIGLLNDVYYRLRDSYEDEQIANQALDELFLALRDCKLSTNESQWRDFVALCRRHPLIGLLHQDPFTFRAFSKPRGYAGDACMMDYIYGREEHWPAPAAEPIGQRVFNYTTLAPASEGVRSRRALIATVIDRMAEERSRPHILSIACGHLREVNLSSAVRRRRTGRFVALDADAESLSEVQRCYSVYGVETVPASFRNLLTNQSRSGQFDLVYSTGLFDYLAPATGRRLVQTMFQMLRPGGTLMVANFLPCVRDIGYMEVFMDWNLIYRSRQDMVELTMEIPEAEIRRIIVSSEEHQNIIFLELTRN